jgi:hypothetical protein
VERLASSTFWFDSFVRDEMACNTCMGGGD